MPVYSMTGYASAQHGAAQPAPGQEARGAAASRLGLEIRSVNSRFLDLTFRLSEELRQHEPVLREAITSRLKRGKVEVRAALETAGADSLREPSPRMLQRLNALQDNVRSWLPDARGFERGRCGAALGHRRRRRHRLVRRADGAWPAGPWTN